MTIQVLRAHPIYFVGAGLPMQPAGAPATPPSCGRCGVGVSLYACAKSSPTLRADVPAHAQFHDRRDPAPTRDQRSRKMERGVFHKLFKTGAAPAVFPVIHVQNFEQAKRNVTVALREGAQGVFLINHDFFAAKLLPIIKQIRAAFPYLWLGVNFLGVTGMLL